MQAAFAESFDHAFQPNGDVSDAGDFGHRRTAANGA